MGKNHLYASDNASPVHPKVMESLTTVNTGHEISYGDDDYTAEARSHIRKLFGETGEVYFVYNGTGANIIGISPFLDSYGAVLCTDIAHINVHECGALQNFTGGRLRPVPHSQGKLRVADVKKILHAAGDEHESQPQVISITQPTEVGTVYTIKEIQELAAFADDNNLKLHMDGARISNAAVSLNVTLEDMIVKTGVHVVSLGGTKNGLMFGEAIVFLNSPGERIKYIRKQSMQLASKMRYIACQFSALYGSTLWLENAVQANRMASLLSEKLSPLPGVTVAYPVESNAVFCTLPKKIIAEMQNMYKFYIWDKEESIVRLMCSFDTTEQLVEEFVDSLSELLKKNSI